MNVQTGAQAVTAASKWLGTPYCWGGGHSGPVPIGTCVDCSGLVNQVFGITGNTGTQVQLGQAVANINSAAPGDLVFFGPLAPGEPYHVGIYTGAGMMIDAPHTGSSVRFDTVGNFGQVDGIRRLVPTGDAQVVNSGGGVQYSYAQLEAVWIQAGGNPQYAPMAAAIAMAESQGIANASNTNGNNSIDRGLWQINSVHGAQSSFDVMTNARAAVAISNQGTNWRPWCTAYSDGACGSKGGCYQCPGSPYMTYLRQGVTPDYSAPINATNAAANTQAVDASFNIFGLNPLSCISGGLANCYADSATSFGTKLAAGTITAIAHSIINPLMQPIAGILGIAAGGVLVLGGAWVMVSQTRAGQSMNKLAFTGAALAAGQPELAAGGGLAGGARRIAGGRASQARFQQRSQVIGAREQQRQAAMQQTAQVRAQARLSTEEQINNAAFAFRAGQQAERTAERERAQQATAARQAKRQADMTERQRQAHRQKMSRARQRARLADRNKK